MYEGAVPRDRMMGSSGPGALAMLGEAGETLQKTIADLEERLSPILRPMMEKTNGIPGPSSPVSAISDRASSIQRLVHDLRRIIERIDL